MKKRVELSNYSVFITLFTLVLLGLIIYYGQAFVWLTVAALVILCFAALCYMPVSLRLGEKALDICRPFKIKSLPMSDIDFVELCQPTMAERRICGSGGWFGYWGWFRDPVIGKYFAYYGKASDCFLVKLKDGNLYLLGCKDAPEMVNAIKERL